MQLYRCMMDLQKGSTIIPKGTVADLENEYDVAPKVIKLLEGSHSIVKVSTPPLDVFPGWRYRAGRLKRAGITTVDALLSTEVSEIAERAGLRAETIRIWQKEALLLLA